MSAFFMKIFFQKSIFGPYTVDNSKHLLNSENFFQKMDKIWGFFWKKLKNFDFFETNFPKNFFSARTSFWLIKTPIYDQIFWTQNQKIDEGVVVEFSNLSETAKSYPLPFETIPQPHHHPLTPPYSPPKAARFFFFKNEKKIWPTLSTRYVGIFFRQALDMSAFFSDKH